MDNDKNNSNNVFHGNFRSVAGRPDLGLSTQSQHFAPLRDQEENLSNLNNEQEEPVVTGMPFSILSPMDGLPAYSMFPTLPKLGRRKRPKIRKRIAQGEGGGSRTELAIGANAEQLIGIVDLATALGREEFEVASEGMDMDTDNDIEDSQDGGDSLECVDNAIMIPQDFPTILDLPFSKKSLACVRPQSLSGSYFHKRFCYKKVISKLAKTREIDPEERLKLNQLLQSKHPSLFECCPNAKSSTLELHMYQIVFGCFSNSNIKSMLFHEQHNLGLPTESNCELSHPSFSLHGLLCVIEVFMKWIAVGQMLENVAISCKLASKSCVRNIYSFTANAGCAEAIMYATIRNTKSSILKSMNNEIQR
eukprot:gene5065-5727_t